MKYMYRFATTRRMTGHCEFNDFLEAVQYMNMHWSTTPGIIRSELFDTITDRMVCSLKGKI